MKITMEDSNNNKFKMRINNGLKKKNVSNTN